MQDFNWSDPERGERINSFLDMLCKDHPKIAECVADRGFGNLSEWFGGQHWKTAKCGCLIGNVALCSVEQHNLYEQIDALMNTLNFRMESDASIIAYLALVILSKASRPEKVTVSGWGEVSFLVKSDTDKLVSDPLFHLLRKIGYDVLYECEEIYAPNMLSEDIDVADKIRSDKLKVYLQESIKYRLKQAA